MQIILIVTLTLLNIDLSSRCTHFHQITQTVSRHHRAHRYRLSLLIHRPLLNLRFLIDPQFSFLQLGHQGYNDIA